MWILSGPAIVLIAICCSLFSTVLGQQDIRRPPSLIKQPIEQKTFRTDSGDALILECVADGTPSSEYVWYKNGQTLTGYGGRILQVEEGTISIPQLGPIDEGYYQCFASNQYGTTMSKTVHLQRALLGGYPGKGIFESGPLTEGTPYTLPCSPTKWFPKPSFSWAIVDSIDDDREKNVILDKRIQMDEEGNLHFSYVVPSDAQDGRLYKCKLFNPILDVMIGGSYARLRVQSVGGVKPFAAAKKFITMSPIIGLEGRNVTLQCFFSGNPEPSILWKKGQGSLPMGRTLFSSFNSELTLTNLTQADAGKYTCIGQNTQGLVQEEIILDIQAIPVFRKIEDAPLDVNVTEGENVVILCQSYAVPPANIVWLRNGEPLKPNALPQKFRMSEEGKRLTIRNLCRDCDGGASSDLMVIQCNASNVHGYAFADGYINILKKTTMSISPTNFTLAADKQVAESYFSTESDDSTPVAMKWYRVFEDHTEEQLQTLPDRVFVDGKGTLRLTFPINSTERAKYGGMYWARASNGYSDVEEPVFLHVEEVAAPPAPQVAGASLWDFWWIIVLVASILLLLILLLCCCICIQRNKGDTYPVDKEERKNKNDPEKEIEDSGFQEYSRPDSKQTRGSHASLLNSLNKIGSDSDLSHDDVSLDYGNEDAGKYTEDGSFIGDYQTENRRGRAGDTYA